MKYRKLGNNNFNISILTAGLFQLDFVTNMIDQSKIDEQIDAVRYAVQNGVNAINLGFPFFMDNPSEYTWKVKNFLAEPEVNSKIKLFINLPVTCNSTLDDFERCLDRLHEWFGIETFDYCLIEDIERFGWTKFERLGGIEWAKRQIEKGRIQKLGFDFRDDCFFLKSIFEAYDWDVAQFRYSFMDSTLHPGFSGVEYVVDAGAGLIATDPFKTRRLLENIPDDVAALWDNARTRHRVDEWALLWIWSHPDFSSVVTSLKNVGEAKHFLALIEMQAPIDMFSEITINKVIDVYKKQRVFGCTECRCCMPCPLDMDSPGIAALYNDYLMYKNEAVPRFLYAIRQFDDIKCEKCGVCTKHCPRRYDIMDAVLSSQKLFG